jgi:predicted  nucleic acid-binding Zn-ribbon protein
VQLQIVDYDLGELERSKDYLPDMMQNLTREIEEAQHRLQETIQSLEEARVVRKNTELELKAKETALQKYQQQMMSIKTNKEYDALVAEIDNIKAIIQQRELELLEAMEKIEQLEKDAVTNREKEAQVLENNQKQLAILQEKMDSIGSKVEDKQQARTVLIKDISRPSLSVYERVRRGRGGRAVVTVKKRACGSCFKALTPKKIQEIKRNDKVLTCDYCGSLLYWDNEESE